MRLAILGLGSGLTLGTAIHAAAAAPASPPSSGAPMIYQKARSFRVPFNIGPSDRNHRREIQLWISEDSGKTWAHKGTTTSDKPALAFHAEHDGEFWLAVRTVDEHGRLHPSDDERVEPSMKVVIDTAPPTLQLRPHVRSASLAAVRWEVRDDGPAGPGKPVLEYQVEGTKEWLPVPSTESASPGMATWDAGFSRALKVRATVTDRAGNKAQTMIDMPSNRPPLATIAAAEAPAPPAGSPLPPRDAATAPASAELPRGEKPADLPPPESDVKSAETRLAPDPVFLNTREKEADPNALPATATATATAAAAAAADQASAAALPPSAPAATVDASAKSAELPASALPERLLPQTDPEPAPAPNSAPPGEPATSTAPAPAPVAETLPTPALPPAETVNPLPPAAAPESNPKIAEPPPGPNTVESPHSEPAASDKDAGTARPEKGETPKLKVPGRRFTLDYAVDGAGPNGPALVELWVTHDGGRSWKKQGKDPDCISPIEVELASEGTYGLSLIAIDAKGQGDKRPVAGDSPQMWVEVGNAPAPRRNPSLLQRVFRR